MFGKKPPSGELDVPPIASEAESVEVLREWVSPGEAQQVSLQVTWKDPGAWGLMLADVARHAANAYGDRGHEPAEALDRIKDLLLAELSNPTDEPQET